MGAFRVTGCCGFQFSKLGSRKPAREENFLKQDLMRVGISDSSVAFKDDEFLKDTMDRGRGT